LQRGAAGGIEIKTFNGNSFGLKYKFPDKEFIDFSRFLIFRMKLWNSVCDWQSKLGRRPKVCKADGPTGESAILGRKGDIRARDPPDGAA
jgi:hypothetical protein